MNRLAAAALLAAALSLPAPAAGGFSESWYLARGRANMDIANYGAAIEAYRKALETNPRSREASRSIGLALLGRAPAAGAILPVVERRGIRWARVAHARRIVPGVWRIGLAYLPAPVATAEAGGYRAA